MTLMTNIISVIQFFLQLTCDLQIFLKSFLIQSKLFPIKIQNARTLKAMMTKINISNSSFTQMHFYDFMKTKEDTLQSISKPNIFMISLGNCISSKTTQSATIPGNSILLTCDQAYVYLYSSCYTTGLNQPSS